MRPSVKVFVKERRSDRLGGVPRDAHVALLGEHIEIQEQTLEKFCYQELSPRAYDLLSIAGAVAFADRVCRRRRSAGWRRDIRLFLPVHDPKFWNSEQFVAQLVDTLVFLTGDNWSFVFRRRVSKAGFLTKQKIL